MTNRPGVNHRGLRPVAKGAGRRPIIEVRPCAGCRARALFDSRAIVHGNDLCFRLSPEVAISLTARVKVPGEGMVREDVRLIERGRPATE